MSTRNWTKILCLCCVSPCVSNISINEDLKIKKIEINVNNVRQLTIRDTIFRFFQNRKGKLCLCWCLWSFGSFLKVIHTSSFRNSSTPLPFSIISCLSATSLKAQKQKQPFPCCWFPRRTWESCTSDQRLIFLFFSSYNDGTRWWEAAGKTLKPTSKNTSWKNIHFYWIFFYILLYCKHKLQCILMGFLIFYFFYWHHCVAFSWSWSEISGRF